MFSENNFSIFISDDIEVEIPVPIPNTEVKHFRAEDSVSKNRTSLIFFCFKTIILHKFIFNVVNNFIYMYNIIRVIKWNINMCLNLKEIL